MSGKLDLRSKDPKLNIDVELSGYFLKKYFAYKKYLSGVDKKHALYYIISRYLGGVRIDNISIPKTKGENIIFNVTGFYLNFAKNKTSVTVFPFFNILDHQYLDRRDAAIYIDFPYSIDVNIDIEENYGSSRKLLFEPKRIGNDSYYADYVFKNVGDKYSVQQNLSVNILTSPLENHADWNTFIKEVKSLENYPIIYELAK